MSNSTSTFIVTIIHEGTVCLLSQPYAKKGKLFSFRFIAINPEYDDWNFRLLDGLESAAVREAHLTHALHRFNSLAAIFNEIEGHPVGMLTVFLPRAGGGAEKISGQAEMGTRIMPNLADPSAGLVEPSPQPNPPAPATPPDLPEIF